MRLNKERQEELEPERMEYAMAELKARGYEPTNNGTRVEFIHKGKAVWFYPYTGWATGSTIKDGRGIKHLLKQLDMTAKPNTWQVTDRVTDEPRKDMSEWHPDTTREGTGTGFVSKGKNNPDMKKPINPETLTFEVGHKHLISSSALAIVIGREKNNHGAEFTMRSKVTGKDYTFKIERSEFKNQWYTHIKVEEGYLNFVQLGTYKGNGVITKKGKVVQTPAAQAIAYVLSRVEQGKFQILDNQVEIMHLGACLVCGATLTDSESITLGLGPVCRKK